VRESGYKNLGRIEIETRPYEFVDFQRVHFDPDPKLWGKSYWVIQGVSKIRSLPDTVSLLGVLDPKVEARGGWDLANFYANDGVAWREYPEPNDLMATFSGGTWPEDPLIAAFKLDSKVVESGRTVTIEAFESTSSKAGQGLGAKLKPDFIRTFDRQRAQVLFARPRAEYVQFKVQASANAWEKVGEATPPTESLRPYTPEDKKQIAAGVNVYVGAFEVVVRGSGSLDFFYKTPTDPNVLKQNLVTWPADGREIRLMARMKTGERVHLYSNGASFSPSPPSNPASTYTFRLNKDGEAELDSFKSRVKLKDIDAFELESRSYSQPQFLVAKLPLKRTR